MVYPDTKCWDNFTPGGIDADGYNKNTGMVPTAFLAMIDRLTGESNHEGGEDENENEGDEGENGGGEGENEGGEGETGMDLVQWLEE